MMCWRRGLFSFRIFSSTNESGVEMFVANDVDLEWRGRRRPVGRYVSTAWIPGNLLVEGTVTIGTGLMTLEPEVVHGIALDAIQFRVVFPLGAGDTARGDYRNASPGVVQPMLRWNTEYQARRMNPSSRRSSLVSRKTNNAHSNPS